MGSMSISCCSGNMFSELLFDLANKVYSASHKMAKYYGIDADTAREQACDARKQKLGCLWSCEYT